MNTNEPPNRTEYDNDGYSADEVREYHKEYGELTDLEMHIVMNVHTHDNCATGIWIGSTLADIAALVESYTLSRERGVLAELGIEVRRYTSKHDQPMRDEILSIITAKLSELTGNKEIEPPKDQHLCGLCGKPMPNGEEMFKYHGHSGGCPS